MTDDFRDGVAAAAETELDRLGSSKRLVALTDATLDDETVLRAAAASEAAAADVFAEWAADASGDAAETFAAFAERERDHYERVAGELGEDVAADPGAVHDFLRGLDDPIEQAGAVVGRGLVAERTLAQFVSYFVNQADEGRADLFRDLRRDTEADTETAIALLADVAEDEAAVERASDAAIEVVSVAYEEYVAALESMGVNAKSVC
ncbi:ferritin domain protein [Halobacterium hubeiense]|uniref:Ferritin domain protein n=1 Tax=Halobacterium hubeiense TaxID=1407499 RepID=A0A0U5CWA7_9EURY|nr:hypothetical protein [Halobacterium hubeiense]CQH50305.1 ferritin domain protein [Halobacterium hubeiense]